MASRYCCFTCPQKDYSLHELDDICPTCGKPYGFPLTHPPLSIGPYSDLKPLSRGFYSATYRGVFGRLARPIVLKVIPIAIYDYFEKDFADECRMHREVAEGTEHLVKIMDASEAEVQFGSEKIACHVAELEYIPGSPLSEFLAVQANRNARAIAQIAIDLFTLLSELENKKVFHNDLHERNIIIQRLPVGSYRARAIDPQIKAVAIDLGSVGDASKSDPKQERLGDIEEVVMHLLSCREQLLLAPKETDDLDYRLASLLDDIAHMLAPNPLGQRTPDYKDIIQQIEDGFQHLSSPWKPPVGFKRFNDSYNAQTLHPWFVPRLLVDPDGRWLAAVSTPGPQVITGIRGCGKTMLLRALQFHARASARQGEPTNAANSSNEKIAGLKHDGFIGLYVSCTRLLEGLGDPLKPLHEPYTKLYVAYAREAIRAARHLREIAPHNISTIYWVIIGKAIQDYVGGIQGLADSESDTALERHLLRILISLDRGESIYSLSANPAIVFPHLAEAVRQCSDIWSSSQVLFLLDDVSTRHLEHKNIADLLGTLLFSSPICAFKMTTEVQTLEQLLRSPGLIEKARPGRDYVTFDLGAEVNKQLRDRNGPEFISKILQQRADQYPNHPSYTPRQMLGDETLESIARKIASTDKTSSQRKEIYHGLRALGALCVGDIGDVISIYGDMLSSHQGIPPIPPRIQSDCFQDYCSKRLYHLNRQGGYLKDAALSFAEAAHELLIKSARQAEQGGRQRLRQYSTIYVRLTTGDTDEQFEKIRDLTDKGVFVLEGGSDAPRTKTRDSNPTQQFILTYRKLFGLSNFIGLAESDRFELSGKALEEWLRMPSKAVLTRNLGDALPPERSTSEVNVLQIPKQLPLMREEQPTKALSSATLKTHDVLLERLPEIEVIKNSRLSKVKVDTMIVGLGFEKRTLVSITRLLQSVVPSKVVLVKYVEKGRGEEIEKVLSDHVLKVVKYDYLDLLNSSEPICDGMTIIDVTGLTKPIIFRSVAEALIQKNEVIVAHTEARQHYPLNKEIKPIFEAKSNGDRYKMLESAGKIWAGEQKPYSFDRLVRSDADDSRRRLLCAASSPKHERLLSLLDVRPFDQVDVIVPAGDSPRDRLAQLAADVATKGLSGSTMKKMASDDLKGMVEFIASRFIDFYVSAGFNIELGLTGSKMHAVACAVASTVFKVAQCWYVRPQSYDPERFTIDVGSSMYYLVRMRNRTGA